LHRRRQQVARGALHHVFSEAAVLGGDVVPTAVRVVFEHDLRRAGEFPRHDLRLGIGNSPAARQHDAERSALELEGEIAERAALTDADRTFGCALQAAPESRRGRVRLAPALNESVDLLVGVFVSVEPPPGAERAAEAQGEIWA
jgi:hypothetical protein